MLHENAQVELDRLAAEAERVPGANWKRWGPYLADRQWGTIREDYSADGRAWYSFPYEQATWRSYRWGEDGLLGICDRQCRLCFAIALWNGNDPLLKERLFGLTGPEGNHGEDVKEYYHYLDSTPTHSYAKALYRYPHATFPYEELIRENAARTLNDPEFEILDTGVFDEDRYFDVQIEYAKASPDDVLVRITATNRGPEEHLLHILPTVWFRNTWIWGCRHEGCSLKPRIEHVDDRTIEASHETLEPFLCHFGPHPDGDKAKLLFTENETNSELLFGTETYTPYVKDAFHRYVVNGETDAVSTKNRGTKVAANYRLSIPAGESTHIYFRMTIKDHVQSDPFSDDFQATFRQRIAEADQFYETVIPKNASEQQRLVSRQAYAGLLWTKQFYHYIVADWLVGDLEVAPPDDQRATGRNHDWGHVYARDVLSMPDKWEYPWFAAWDLAFHMIPMAKVDPGFAKQQLLVLLREWYMHPNGQLPAYEFAFYDVNPPVHAWACYRVYQMTGSQDKEFLAKAFQRLLLNFTWWVNQVDVNGDNVFAGGFLGLDNIGLFDRTDGLPEGTQLEQADGTAWMAFYCGTMLSMSLELARDDPAYAEMASKFLDHFVRITDAINTLEGDGLWLADEGFYFDHLRVDGKWIPLKVRSLVGLLPLIAVEVLDEDLIQQLPTFQRRWDWFLKYRHDLAKHIAFAAKDADQKRTLLAIPTRKKLEQVLTVLLDETEFLSDYGIRSLSKVHGDKPFRLDVHGQEHSIAYVPGVSDSWMFGGNSNWRGPIWFPVNYLLIEAIERYYEFYGDDLKVECPVGSGTMMTLREVSTELNTRLTKLFLPCDETGERPCVKRESREHANWNNELLFHEYFHGETGEGLGASHQTGWTALVANCIDKLLNGNEA
ncbi:MAG: glucosidase [Planctomycetales bacterium]|nr:glucosidase [Planctomycetales bacterium]